MKQKFDYARYNVFDAVVHQKRVAAGDKYKVIIKENTNSDGFGNISVFTKGRITGVFPDGSPLLFERVPGVHTLDREFIPAGEFTFTAQEDSEWWCINRHLSQNIHITLEKIKIFSLAAGASTTLVVGTKLLLCEGNLQIGNNTFSAGSAVEISSANFDVTATTNCYGFLFK